MEPVVANVPGNAPLCAGPSSGSGLKDGSIESASPASAADRTLHAASSGQKTLVLVRDENARASFRRALEERGLSDLALDLTGQSTARSVLAELRRVAAPARSAARKGAGDLGALEAMESRINLIPDTLSRPARDSGLTAYEAAAKLIARHPRMDHEARLDDTLLDRWNAETYEKALALAEAFDRFIERNGSPRTSPWRGCALPEEGEIDQPAISRQIEAAERALASLREASTPLFAADALSLPHPATLSELRLTLSALSQIGRLETENGALLLPLNFRNSAWTEAPDRVAEALDDHLSLAELSSRLLGKVDLEKLAALDLRPIATAVAEYSKKGGIRRLFDSAYEKAVAELRTVLDVPDSPARAEKVVAILESVKELQTRCAAHEKLLRALFRDEDPPRDLLSWRKRCQVGWAVQRFLALVQDLPENGALLQALRDPKRVYEQGVRIEEAAALTREYDDRLGELLSSLGMDAERRREHFGDVSLEAQEKRLRAMRASVGRIEDWRDFGKAGKAAEGAGMPWLAEETDRAGAVRPGIAYGLTHAWLASLVRGALAAEPRLAAFDGQTQAQVVERFQSAVREARERAGEEAVKRRREALARSGAEIRALLAGGGAEDSSLFQLFSLAGDAVLAAKPIVIADSETVQNDLEPVLPRFSETFVIREEAKKLAAESAGHAPDPFVEHLRNILEQEGFSVSVPEPALPGGADLVVHDPGQARGRPVGVRVDGYAYQSAGSAREREVSAQDAGPSIHREWILDWHRDPNARRSEFLSEIRRALGKPASVTLPDERQFLD